MREIILDTETTGLNPSNGDRIVEIGAIEMIDKVLSGNQFHVFINPEREVPEEAYRIHGLSTEFLSTKQPFRNIVAEFLEFIEGGTLVIHNAPFDVGFINYELSLLKLPSIKIDEVIDTLSIARKLFPGARTNLDALCKRFKIDNSMRTNHTAIVDAKLLAEVYIELTGGRQTSFTIDKKIVKNQFFQVGDRNSTGNKIVIYPTESESEAHNLLMSKIIGF